MTWKVKDMKEFLENKQDEDVLQFYSFDYGSEGFTNFVTIGRITTRKPKKDEFEHHECKYCEKVLIKDVERLYCSRNDTLLRAYDEDSCYDFQHKDYEVEYTE